MPVVACPVWLSLIKEKFISDIVCVCIIFVFPALDAYCLLEVYGHLQQLNTQHNLGLNFEPQVKNIARTKTRTERLQQRASEKPKVKGQVRA